MAPSVDHETAMAERDTLTSSGLEPLEIAMSVAVPPQHAPMYSDDPGPTTARIESLALYAALGSGVVGAVFGLVLTAASPPLGLSGPFSFGWFAAAGAAVVAAVTSGVGYRRVRQAPEQQWRRALSSPVFTINTIAVGLVHVSLTALVTLVAFLILGMAFIGLTVDVFWGTVLMALTLGLSAYVVFLSVSRLTTQRMSTLLMAFVVIGTLTAMVTTPDPVWWETHFSHLGTFWDLSSAIFNGTLIVGGLLVTTFAVYLSNDMTALARDGRLARASSPRTVSTMFVVMGAMLAGVGLVPVNINLLIHNLCATGMALMFLGLLVSGPRVLRGMPRAYFVGSWVFLAATLLSAVLFATGFFGLTALEIVLFALIFGWISVFIRFLAVVGTAPGLRARG